MAIKTILACVSNDESGHNVLDTALRIGSHFDAHVEALHVRADPRSIVPYTGEGMDGSMSEEIMEVTEREGGQRSLVAKQMFDEFCQSNVSVTLAETPREN